VKPVGYLFNTKEGPIGEVGLYYDYLVAQNGLFLRADNPLLRATICISPAEIRGLSPLEERIELVHGKIPQALYHLALSVMLSSRDREQYLAITWEDEYHLRMPPQERNTASVRYHRLPNSVVDIHSHAHMGAFFSLTDNEDEQGLSLYMVIGKLDTLIPEVEIRLGVYGYHIPLNLEEIFDV